MALLRVNGQPDVAAVQERNSIAKKHFAAYNRKLEIMVTNKAPADYIAKVADSYKMTKEDLSEKVVAYIKEVLEAQSAPAPEAKKEEAKKAASPKKEKAEVKSEPAAE